MKSYLLSALAARYKGKGLASFVEGHWCDWLLWEPGAWKPPSQKTVTFSPLASPDAKAGEALAMELEHAQGRLSLGRDETSTLVINDGTLSSTHLYFNRGADGAWTVEDAGSRNGSWVDGVRLVPSRAVPLKTGARIVAAQVVLTFYTPDGLWKRLGV